MEGTLFAAQITKIATLVDGSVSITSQTQELSPGKVGELFALRNKIAYVYISERQISLPEQKMVDKLEPEMKGKTPSLRLRNVLFVLYQQDNEGYPDADSFYRSKMEHIIETYKGNLKPNF